jgi:membrane protein DedA with SNARE-associated domain
MILLGVACLIGGFVGLYFNVLILVPLTAALPFACCLSTAGHGDMISAALFSFIPAAIGLQGGYMIGLTARDLFRRSNTAQSKRI